MSLWVPWSIGRYLPNADILVVLPWVKIKRPGARLNESFDLFFEVEVWNNDVRINRHAGWGALEWLLCSLTNFYQHFNGLPVVGTSTLKCHWVVHQEAANVTDQVLWLVEFFLCRFLRLLQDDFYSVMKFISIDSPLNRCLLCDVKLLEAELNSAERSNELQWHLAASFQLLKALNFFGSTQIDKHLLFWRLFSESVSLL